MFCSLVQVKMDYCQLGNIFLYRTLLYVSVCHCCTPAWRSVNVRDGNSSQRLGLESHLSRINKDSRLDLDSWTADSRLDLDSWLVRLVKNESFGIGVYMNVSLRETGCLKKSLDGIFFSSCLRVMHISVHNRSSALFTAETKETMFNWCSSATRWQRVNLH